MAGVLNEDLAQAVERMLSGIERIGSQVRDGQGIQASMAGLAVLRTRSEDMLAEAHEGGWTFGTGMRLDLAALTGLAQRMAAVYRDHGSAEVGIILDGSMSEITDARRRLGEFHAVQQRSARALEAVARPRNPALDRSR